MSWKSARVVAIAAFVAVLLGGGIATARSLIKGSDIRSSTITGRNVKSKSIPLSDLTKGTQNRIRKAGQGEKGDTGDRGPQGTPGAVVILPGTPGANGTNGANGAAGKDALAGKVTPRTQQVYGFLPWRDAPDASSVGFTASALTLASSATPDVGAGKGGSLAGVALPIASGTQLRTLKDVGYTATSTEASKAVSLGIELVDEVSNIGTYTTIVYTPAAGGKASPFTDATPHWRSTGNAFGLDKTQTYTYAQIKAALDGAGNPSKKFSGDQGVQVLGSHLVIGSGQSTTKVSATVSSVTLQHQAAAAGVAYTFGTD